MSIEDLEEDRRYGEAAGSEGKDKVFATRVRLLNVPRAVVVPRETSVGETAKRMTDARQGCAVVAGPDGRVAGIFTERDLLMRVVAKGLDPARTEVGKVMSADPECLTLDDTLGYALYKMTVGNYRSVPVVDDDGKPTGVLTQHEGVKALASLFPTAVFNQPSRSVEQKPPRHQHGG
ncbi:MAG TPA: CBS domain-containing protein [Planctomycetota bacterium]|nr:CBS domain-containing protein [Planctomycetota bacterium]